MVTTEQSQNNLNQSEELYENVISDLKKYLNIVNEFEKQSIKLQENYGFKVLKISLPKLRNFSLLLKIVINDLIEIKNNIQSEKMTRYDLLLYLLRPVVARIEDVNNKILSIEPNIAITIRFNRYFEKDERFKIYSIVKHILQDFQKFYGIHNKRMSAIGIIEKNQKELGSHIHIALHNPVKPTVDIEDYYALKTIAKLHVASSDVNIQEIFNKQLWIKYMFKYFKDSDDYFQF